MGLRERIRFSHVWMPLFAMLVVVWAAYALSGAPGGERHSACIIWFAIMCGVVVAPFAVFCLAIRVNTTWVRWIVGLILLGVSAWAIWNGLIADRCLASLRHWTLFYFLQGGLMVRAPVFLHGVLCLIYSTLLIGPLLPRRITPRMVRLAPRFALAILVLIDVGYISSAVTKTKCENSVARWIVSGPMMGRQFYIRHGDSDSWVIFQRVHASCVEYVTLPRPYKFTRVTWPEGDPVPTVDDGGRSASVSGGRITFPFIMSVGYSTSSGSLAGEGAVIHFLCFFGLRVKVGKVQYWVS